MENIYKIDFENRKDDEPLYAALVNNLGTKLDSILRTDKDNLGLSKNQKKAFDSLPKSKATRIQWLIKAEKESILKDKINNRIYKMFNKYDESLFSLDEKTRFETIKKIITKNPDDKTLKDYIGLCIIFGIPDSDEVQEFNKQLEKKNNDAELKTQLEESKNEYEKLKKEYNDETKKWTKEKEKLNKSINEEKQKSKKTKDDNDKLKKEIEDKDKLINELQNSMATIKKETVIDAPVIQEEVDLTPVRKKYPASQLMNAISRSTFLGRANLRTLQLDQNDEWIVGITPRENMLRDTKLSDLDGLREQIINPNNELNFLFFIKDDYIKDKLQIKFFDLLDEKEQRAALYNALLDKEIIFDASFSQIMPIDGKRRLNAFNVELFECNENEFSSTTLVPEVKLSKKVFMDAIANKQNIIVEEYSACLHSGLKYIVCDNELYFVNLEPTENEEEWKSKDGISKVICDDVEQKIYNSSERICISYYSENDNRFLFIKDEKLTFLRNQSNTIVSLDNKPEETETEVLNIESNTASSEKEFIESVYDRAHELHLDYTKKDIVNFHLALKTSQLVILAGSTGTGKTQLPFVYTKALNMAEGLDNVLFVPISPSYTEPSDILGYFKPNIATSNNESEEQFDGTYMEAETGLVKFLINASKNRNQLYAIIFDEMNLSQIEYWFSPFMSILERKVGDRKLQLYSDSIKCSNKNIIPSSIDIGDNVLFIGTINLDETTKELSDRLIDRSIIINLDKKNIKDYFGAMEDNKVHPKHDPVDNSLFFTFKHNEDNFIVNFTKEEIDFFQELNDYINHENSQKEISYRTLKTIANYLNNIRDLDDYINRSQALDLIVKQTLIMKIKGSDNSVRKMLDKDTGIASILDKYPSISEFSETKSALERKLNELNNYGYTR